MNSDSSKFCLVYTLSAPWDGYHRKPFIQYIADAILPLNGVVLCLEPTLTSLHTLLKYPERIIKWLRGQYKFRNVNENIYVFSPKTLEHLFLSVRFSPLRRINSYLIQKQLRKVLKVFNLDTKSCVLVVHRPELYFLKEDIEFKGMVYDCWDDFCSTSDMKSLKVLGNIKREVLTDQKSSFIIATSELLFKRNHVNNANTYLIENGFSEKLFNKGPEIGNNIKRDLTDKKNFKKPVIGYVGNIKSWIDFSLIEYLVTSRKEWTFLFVGPLWAEYGHSYKKFLDNNKNVFVTGYVDYSDFPSYLRIFDVGIIPFYQNEFMKAVNPNKFYEYLGAGIPVVSTDVGDLKLKYGSFVRISRTNEEFLMNLDELVKMDDFDKRKLREKILNCSKNHTLESNTKYFTDLLKKHIIHDDIGDFL